MMFHSFVNFSWPRKAAEVVWRQQQMVGCMDGKSKTQPASLTADVWLYSNFELRTSNFYCYS